MGDDLDLVRKYARERDARAFAEIASRYGGLVYGVCLRVTGSADDAEDIAQDCFVKLAESAAAIDVPLARWLHTLARSRAVDAVRARAARRRHEEAAVGERPDATGPTWDDVSAHVDDALAGLPDDLRDPLVLHFLLGRAQTDVAAQLGVDQSTVSRRIDRGVGELRGKLRKAGVVASAALLATLLTDNAASAAVPATLTAALGRMALAGVGKGAAAAAGASAAGGAVVALKTKLIVAAAVGVIAAGGIVTYRVVTGPGEADRIPAPTQVATPRPEGPAQTDEAGAEDAMMDPSKEPDITITPVPGEGMTVRATGYGPGLAGTSHLRVGRREVTNWYDSPSGELRETDEAVVTRTVRLLGRDCFEVRARSRKAGETEWSDPGFEYFFVDAAGTHWVKPKEGRAADLADDGAWETWDHLEGEGVSPVEVSTERPEANSTVEVVDLTIGGETVRCLRETFFEVEGGRVRYGGDVFRREDGTSILYYRLLAEGMKEYDALEGAREYELGGATLRVWETVRLVEESDPDEGAAGGRDYSKLALEGEHWRDDSFSLVMRAVARLFGREADYETVFPLSTNGFAPDVRPGDPCCKGTWRMFGRGRNVDVVAAYLGLTVRRLEFPKPPPLPAPDAQGRRWGTPAYNEWLDDRKKACAAVVGEALGTGAVVIADGGWRNHEWFLWGVITEARPDGTIIGKTLSPPLTGELDYCFMDHIRSYWTVTSAETRLPQEEADLSMLRRAVARIRGDRAPFLPGEVLFGLPAMDRWIEQMRKPAFQEDDPASSAGNARVNADVSSHGALAVSAYLRRRIGSFPEAVRPHLEAVARRYDRIAGLLRPFAVWEEGKGYRALMGKTGDLEKQKAHAESVLLPVKRELAAAADEIERALASCGVYLGAAGLRDDLYGLMNGLDKAQELEWGRVFGRDAEGRAEELAKLCGRYKCTQVVEREGTILWLNGDGRIEAMFCYMPDAGDLAAFRDVYRRVERTDSPLTFVVLPQPGRKDTFDAHMISRRSCLEHSWELGIKAKAEPLPLAKGIRKELYEMFRTPADAPTSPLSKPERAYWSWRLSHSDEKAAAKLGRDAKHFGCTQSVDGGCILWKGADGKPAVMFRVVRDPKDPKVLRRVYDRMMSEDIPLAYCFVNAYRFDGTNRLGDWDVWSMSRQKAQTHCWRFWAHEARPESGEAEPESDVF